MKHILMAVLGQKENQLHTPIVIALEDSFLTSLEELTIPHPMNPQLAAACEHLKNHSEYLAHLLYHTDNKLPKIASPSDYRSNQRSSIVTKKLSDIKIEQNQLIIKCSDGIVFFEIPLPRVARILAVYSQYYAENPILDHIILNNKEPYIFNKSVEDFEKVYALYPTCEQKTIVAAIEDFFPKLAGGSQNKLNHLEKTITLTTSPLNNAKIAEQLAAEEILEEPYHDEKQKLNIAIENLKEEFRDFLKDYQNKNFPAHRKKTLSEEEKEKKESLESLLQLLNSHNFSLLKLINTIGAQSILENKRDNGFFKSNYYSTLINFREKFVVLYQKEKHLADSIQKAQAFYFIPEDNRTKIIETHLKLIQMQSKVKIFLQGIENLKNKVYAMNVTLEKNDLSTEHNAVKEILDDSEDRRATLQNEIDSLENSFNYLSYAITNSSEKNKTKNNTVSMEQSILSEEEWIEVTHDLEASCSELMSILPSHSNNFQEISEDRQKELIALKEKLEIQKSENSSDLLAALENKISPALENYTTLIHEIKNLFCEIEYQFREELSQTSLSAPSQRMLKSIIALHHNLIKSDYRKSIENLQSHITLQWETLQKNIELLAQITLLLPRIEEYLLVKRKEDLLAEIEISSNNTALDVLENHYLSLIVEMKPLPSIYLEPELLILFNICFDERKYFTLLAVKDFFEALRENNTDNLYQKWENLKKTMMPFQNINDKVQTYIEDLIDTENYHNHDDVSFKKTYGMQKNTLSHLMQVVTSPSSSGRGSAQRILADCHRTIENIGKVLQSTSSDSDKLRDIKAYWKPFQDDSFLKDSANKKFAEDKISPILIEAIFIYTRHVDVPLTSDTSMEYFTSFHQKNFALNVIQILAPAIINGLINKKPPYATSSKKGAEILLNRLRNSIVQKATLSSNPTAQKPNEQSFADDFVSFFRSKLPKKKSQDTTPTSVSQSTSSLSTFSKQTMTHQHNRDDQWATGKVSHHAQSCASISLGSTAKGKGPRLSSSSSEGERSDSPARERIIQDQKGYSSPKLSKKRE